MKFVSKAGDLSSALERAALGLDPKAKNIAALTHVHIVATAAGVTIRSNLMDYSVLAKTEAEVEEIGQVALPGERLSALAKAFPAAGSVAIANVDVGATVSSGGARYRLPGIKIGDLPQVPEIRESLSEISVAREEMLALLAPAPFAGTESTRFYLNGICLHDIDATLAAVATDGGRLLRVTIPGSFAPGRELIVPNKTVAILTKLIRRTGSEIVTLRRTKTLFEAAAAEFAIVSKLIDATFPDYERLLPKEPPANSAEVAIAELGAALTRLSLAADLSIEGTPVIELRWGAGDEAISLRLGRQPGCEEIISAVTVGSARVAVAARQLEDIRFGKRIRFGVSSEREPILINDPENDGVIRLVMPIRWTFEETQEEAA
jgi:DNA polymerase-3 subunit beta